MRRLREGRVQVPLRGGTSLHPLNYVYAPLFTSILLQVCEYKDTDLFSGFKPTGSASSSCDGAPEEPEGPEAPPAEEEEEVGLFLSYFRVYIHVCTGNSNDVVIFYRSRTPRTNRSRRRGAHRPRRRATAARGPPPAPRPRPERPSAKPPSQSLGVSSSLFPYLRGQLYDIIVENRSAFCPIRR